MPERTLHVLLVDDDPADRLHLRQLLVASGDTVDDARDTTEAIEALRGRRYDAVLLDRNLLDGLDSAACLTQIVSLAGGAPVLLVSGAMSTHDALAAVELGAARAYLKSAHGPAALPLGAELRQLIDARYQGERAALWREVQELQTSIAGQSAVETASWWTTLTGKERGAVIGTVAAGMGATAQAVAEVLQAWLAQAG